MSDKLIFLMTVILICLSIFITDLRVSRLKKVIDVNIKVNEVQNKIIENLVKNARK